MRQTIPTYDLSTISDHGFIVERITDRINSSEDNLLDKGIHRDSHYIFTFLQTGHVKMMVDFKIIEAKNGHIYCVLPGQVHQGLLMNNACGWFIALNVDLVPDFVRSAFEEYLVDIMPLPVSNSESEKFNKLAQVLFESCTEEMMATKENFFIIKSLLNAYTGMFASHFLNECSHEKQKENRTLELARQFRILVRKNFITQKSASGYAEIMNISPGYLTEVISKATGKSPSYWIQQEVLLEAKRLLFFTNCTVKEIAYQLGYNDHTYFSRLFSRSEGGSPLSFRNKSKK